MSKKEHLDATLKLWYFSISELKGLQSFLHIEKINDQFYRRLLIRGIFSVIETYLNVTKEIIKIKVVTDSDQELNWKELAILNGQRVQLNKDGNVSAINEFQKFESTMKFTLNLFAKTFGTNSPDYKSLEFKNLMKLVERRNQFTHPKSLDHLFVTNSEIKEMIDSFTWFFNTHAQNNDEFVKWIEMHYPNLK